MPPKRKLYLDTSILGFAIQKIDRQRKAEANLLLAQIGDGHFLGGYSFVTEAEIDAAPKRIALRLWRRLARAGLRRVRVRSREQVHDLANRYCQLRVIPDESFDDALHVAIATLWRADALVSYNFTHIVRLDTMIRVNEINEEQGLAHLHLCQPSEVILT